MKKLIMWGGAGIVVLIILVALAGGGDEPEKVGTTSDNPQPTTQTKETTTTYQIGDMVKMGDVILTVNSVETSTGGQYTAPADGNEWVNLNITIENTGSTQEYITTMGQMFIIDSERNQYQVAVTDKSLENPGSFGLDGAIVANSKKTDWVGFEVPVTSEGLQFQYNASFWSNQNILVDLGM